MRDELICLNLILIKGGIKIGLKFWLLTVFLASPLTGLLAQDIVHDGEYNIKPDDYGTEWNIRIQIAPVVPSSFM